MRILGAALAAWLAGLAAYELLLRIVWKQTTGGDWAAVAFWSAIAWALAAPLVYVPALVLLRKLLGGFRPMVLFPLLAAFLGVAPTALIAVRWGGNLRALATPEAALFLGMFTVVGLVFGSPEKKSAARPPEPEAR
jgi:hypothetical protein